MRCVHSIGVSSRTCPSTCCNTQEEAGKVSLTKLSLCFLWTHLILSPTSRINKLFLQQFLSCVLLRKDLFRPAPCGYHRTQLLAVNTEIRPLNMTSHWVSENHLAGHTKIQDIGLYGSLAWHSRAWHENCCVLSQCVSSSSSVYLFWLAVSPRSQTIKQVSPLPRIPWCLGCPGRLHKKARSYSLFLSTLVNLCHLYSGWSILKH